MPASVPSAVILAKALAHPARLRILGMLRDGPLCVCQMTSVLELAPSTVSAHLLDLKRGGAVLEQKQGKWVYYRLAEDAAVLSVVSPILAMVEHDARVRQDGDLVAHVRAVPVEVLCRVGLDLEAVGISRPAAASPDAAGRAGADGKAGPQ
ncbi:MAG TPA: metalloregulator ArsR/SmtB family transcription factor [Vicinamibacterales bacterium]|nr:metalloregulator ArsR/SmtB family transcription factor [Vicinamibacterales bacterium]